MEGLYIYFFQLCTLLLLVKVIKKRDGVMSSWRANAWGWWLLLGIIYPVGLALLVIESTPKIFGILTSDIKPYITKAWKWFINN